MPDFGISHSVLEGVPDGADPVTYIRASSPLPLHAEELIDNTVTENALDRLTIVKDMMEMGLTTDLPNWLGVMNYKWQKRGRAGNPQFGMLPDITAQREDFKFAMDFDSLPVYCITEHFTIHPRLFAEWQEANRRGVNLPLDTTMVADAERRMNETIEEATIYGPPADFKPNGQTIPGLLSGTNVFPFGGGVAWDNSGKTGPQIYSDVGGMVDQAIAQHHYGPYVMYVGTSYGRVLQRDYVTTLANTKTVMSRILEDVAISDIKVADRLPKDSVLLIEPKKTNFDLIIGQQPAALSWMEGPTALAIRNWIMLACVFLRVREDSLGQTGIVVGRPTL